jgi:hypothetical protein
LSVKQDANQSVRDTTGECLFSQPFTVPVLAEHGFGEFSHEEKQQFIDAVADEAVKYAVEEKNMNGVVYAEDAMSGRSPTAQDLDVTMLNVVPRQLITSQEVERLGCLCLRHPLPAVVFANRQPQSKLIEVGETTEALGFHLPIFLSVNSYQPIIESLFALIGIFFIPAPDEYYGELWNGVIQNSTRFSEGLKIFEGSSYIEVEVEW